MHVLVRQKPKKAAAKKGEAAPPPDAATLNRGDFVGDLKNVLGISYGVDLSGKTPQADATGPGDLQEHQVPAQNGDDILAYFATDPKSGTDVAIIVEVPPALRTNRIVTKGVDNSLKSFALGAPARNKFNGATPPAPPAPRRSPRAMARRSDAPRRGRLDRTVRRA